MSLVKEVEKVIAQLPLPEATMLKYWLEEYEAARRYKQIKAYAKAITVLANFKKNNGNALWN
jgi:hypothetical protein